MFSIRKGPWKLVVGNGSGGWSKGGDDQPGQLYNLTDDLGETKNLYAKKPDVAKELTELLGKYVADGRSTPGAKQKNDVPVRWKEKAVGKAKEAALSFEMVIDD